MNVENDNVFEIVIDNISVPSREPPARKTSPTPKPKIEPPKTVAKRESVVIGFM